METVKVLSKGQITLPVRIRKAIGVKEGDRLFVEHTPDGIILKKGKTIFDYAGTLPDIGLSVEQIRETATTMAFSD
jgi:AbrB family looped-hinge helix DNA binding protein